MAQIAFDSVHLSMTMLFSEQMHVAPPTNGVQSTWSICSLHEPPQEQLPSGEVLQPDAMQVVPLPVVTVMVEPLPLVPAPPAPAPPPPGLSTTTRPPQLAAAIPRAPNRSSSARMAASLS